MLYNYNIFEGYDRVIAARRLYRFLSRGTRYQQIINTYMYYADDHCQHPKKYNLLFK